MANSRIKWIDGGKGVAMLMVMAVHLSQKYSWLPGTLFSFGAMGVQLFFLLSGYCLCKNPRCNNKHYMKRELINRYRRLAPWYLVGIAIYAVYYWFSENWMALEKFTPLNICANVLMVNSFFPVAQNTIVPGGWSISCIALFSFCFPIFILNEGRVRLCLLSVFSFIGTAIAVIGYNVLDWPRQYTYCSIMNQFVVFALGAIYCSKAKLFSYIRPIFAIGVALVFFIIAVATVLIDREYSILYRHIIVSISFISLFPLLERFETYLPSWLIWVGRHSYEIFILHFLAIWLLPTF